MATPSSACILYNESMILVCDRGESGRAASIRERILRVGVPAAVSALASLREHLPVRLIVTFTDVFDEVRRMSCDDVFAVVIGDGFVNTALNAVRAPADRWEPVVRDALFRQLGIGEAEKDPFGVFLTAKLFFSPYFTEYRGRQVFPTAAEKLVFLHLFGCSDERHPRDAGRIERFCRPAGRKEPDPDGAQNRIAAHVAHINAKFADAIGTRLIRETRGKGYFIAAGTL